MERRISERYHRYLPVRLWLHGESDSSFGHTANISHTGLYMVSTKVYPSGTRVRLEVGDARSFWVEGVVARSLRAPRELQRVKPAGMGIRFLGVTELVSELLEHCGPMGRPSPESSHPESETARNVPAREVPAREVPAREVPDQPDANLGFAGRSPSHVAPGPASPESEQVAPMPPVQPAAPGGSVSGGARFRLCYPHAAALQAAIGRDLCAGGLFVPTLEPAPLDSVVVVHVIVGGGQPGHSAEVVARVVHRIEATGPGAGLGGPNLMAGMGVQVLDTEAARRALEGLLVAG